MFVRGRAWADEVTVARVPEISGSWAALREHCDLWRGAVQAARAGVEEQQSTWSGMQAAYDEPETAGAVHTALDPLIDPAQLWAGAVERVAEAVESFATTAEALEAEADALQQRRSQVLQAARDVEHAGADDDVDAERLQIQDFAWDVASLRHRWEQAQSGVADAIEQQGRVLASVVLPQSAGSGLFSAAGFGVGSVIGSAIGSALSGGLGGAFDPSEVDVDLPPIPTSLSEEERRRYREENPQALEDLMEVDLDELDDETRQQVESAIIRLAVPDVDSSDGETDAETVEEALSDETMADEMTEAFGRSTEVGDGLDSLEDWAASNEVDLEESETVAGAMGYLGAFHRATYARRDEVEKYLEDGARTEDNFLWPDEYEHVADEEQLTTIRQGWADGLLTLSREDYGGGWDELPEGVREAAQHPDGAVDFDAFRELMPLLEHADSGRSPGDDLATNLAMAAEYVLHVENARADSAAGADPGVPESALTTALGLAGRNESASAALLAGSGDVDGFDGAELPDSFDSSRFVANVFDKDWEDDGAAVAGLIDWIGAEYREYADARSDVMAAYEGQELDEQLDELNTRASDAWYGLMESVSDTEVGGGPYSSDSYSRLMGSPGDSDFEPRPSDGAFERNGALATSFYRTVAENLEEFTTSESKIPDSIDDEDHVRIMALLTSNEETAAMTAASVREFQAGRVADYVDAPHASNSVGSGLGRLQAKMEAGIYEVAERDSLASSEAERKVIGTIRVGSELAAVVWPNPVTGAGSAVIQSWQVSDVSAMDTAPGDGIELQNRGLLHRGRINAWILEALGGDPLGDVPDLTVPKSELPDDLLDVSNREHEVNRYPSDSVVPLNAIVDSYHKVSESRLDAFVESEEVPMTRSDMRDVGDAYSEVYSRVLKQDI